MSARACLRSPKASPHPAGLPYEQILHSPSGGCGSSEPSSHILCKPVKICSSLLWLRRNLQRLYVEGCNEYQNVQVVFGNLRPVQVISCLGKGANAKGFAECKRNGCRVSAPLAHRLQFETQSSTRSPLRCKEGDSLL